MPNKQEKIRENQRKIADELLAVEEEIVKEEQLIKKLKGKRTRLRSTDRFQQKQLCRSKIINAFWGIKWTYGSRPSDSEVLSSLYGEFSETMCRKELKWLKDFGYMVWIVDSGKAWWAVSETGEKYYL